MLQLAQELKQLVNYSIKNPYFHLLKCLLLQETEYLWVFDCFLEKTSNLKTSPWGFGKLWRAFFSVFNHGLQPYFAPRSQASYIHLCQTKIYPSDCQTAKLDSLKILFSFLKFSLELFFADGITMKTVSWTNQTVVFRWRQKPQSFFRIWVNWPFNALCPTGGEEMFHVRLQADVRWGQQPRQPHHRERGHHLRPQPPQDLVAVGERWEPENTREKERGGKKCVCSWMKETEFLFTPGLKWMKSSVWALTETGLMGTELSNDYTGDHRASFCSQSQQAQGAGLTGVLRRTGVRIRNRCVSSLEHTQGFKVGKKEVCNETAAVQRAPQWEREAVCTLTNRVNSPWSQLCNWRHKTLQ